MVELLVGVPVLLLFASLVGAALGIAWGDLFAWIIRAAIAIGLIRVALVLVMSVLTHRPRIQRREPPRLRTPLGRPTPDPGLQPGERPRGVSPAARAREASLRLGGGAYLGLDEYGAWVCADQESAVMVLGPPRSGKTSAVMIPALMACPGPALSTSTKPDVLHATLAARSEVGQAWLFDPAGSEDHEPDSTLPEGVRRLCWSPVAAATSWDQALSTARAMTAASPAGAGTTNASHWSERAGALLAPLLYAAHLTGRPIEQVLRWTLRQELTPAIEILDERDTQIAADVLAGIKRTDERERSSIFSATAGVLAAYNADTVRTSAAHPNFDPHQFTCSQDTIYITAPEHKQALCAPLIVGLLEEIRHAVYRHARQEPLETPRMLWLLDEVANIAPIHDLPALVSQAGGQGLQVTVGLQDLSQARTRWGQDAADGFLSLFQTKLIISGIADPRTLEALSLALGEYDRRTASQTLGRTDPEHWQATPTHSDSVTYQTHRQRVLSAGEVAHLPDDHGLVLQGLDWQLVELTRWHEREPWLRIANIENSGKNQW
jgi:type IV secretion system protein VirD4